MALLGPRLAIGFSLTGYGPLFVVVVVAVVVVMLVVVVVFVVVAVVVAVVVFVVVAVVVASCLYCPLESVKTSRSRIPR